MATVHQMQAGELARLVLTGEVVQILEVRAEPHHGYWKGYRVRRPDMSAVTVYWFELAERPTCPTVISGE